MPKLRLQNIAYLCFITEMVTAFVNPIPLVFGEWYRSVSSNDCEVPLSNCFLQAASILPEEVGYCAA